MNIRYENAISVNGPFSNKNTYQKLKWEYLYLGALMLYLACAILEYTDMPDTAAGKLLSLLRYLCYAAALVKILFSDMKERRIWLIGALLGVATMVALQSDNKKVLFFTLMIVASEGIAKERLLKAACIAQGITVGCVIFASLMGLTSNYLFDITTRTRHSLGFNWATIAPIMYFFWMLEYICLRQKRLLLIEIVLMEAVNYWFFDQTNSRMCFYLASLMLLCTAVLKGADYVRRVYRIRYEWKGRWLIGLPFLCCIVSVALHVFYNPYNHLLKKINSILTKRLFYGKSAVDQYGIPLLGQPIKWIGNADTGVYNYVDCSYMQILLEFGLVVLLLVVTAYTYLMLRSVKAKNLYFQMAIAFIVIFSITEPRLFQLAFNPFLILTFSIWTNRQSDGAKAPSDSFTFQTLCRSAAP